jgi:hypothetical protein
LGAAFDGLIAADIQNSRHRREPTDLFVVIC